MSGYNKYRRQLSFQCTLPPGGPGPVQPYGDVTGQRAHLDGDVTHPDDITT